jgi:hypothetical protein
MSSARSNLTYNEGRDLFDQFLRCIDREENLINYRLTWGLQWNIACFAALFAMESGSMAPGNIAPEAKPFIQLLLSTFGMVSSTLSSIGVRAAHAQSKYLIGELNKRLGVESDDDWARGKFIRPYGKLNTVHSSARWVSGVLPVLFISLWLIVAWYAAFHEGINWTALTDAGRVLLLEVWDFMPRM